MKKTLLIILLFLFIQSARSQSPCSDSVAVSVCTYSSNGDPLTYKLVSLYDSLRNIISKIQYGLGNNHWNKLSEHLYEYSYDGFGHILSNLHKSSTDNSFPRNYSNDIYYYNSPTHQSEHSTYYWNGSRWVNDTRNLFYSNGAGDDTLVVTENGDTAGWNNYIRTYSYYDNNHLSIHDSIQRWSGFWWLYQENFTSYSGNLVDSQLTIVYNSSGAIINQNYVLHQFDSSTMNMYHSYYMWDGNQWIGGLGDSTLYDAWGHVILYSDGETYGYLYDSLGNLLEYHYHGSGQSSSDVTYTYVNGVLRSSNGSGSSQGGWTSSTSCAYRYADISGPVTSCGNSSIVLSAQPCTPGNQYLWNTSETTQSIIGSSSNSFTVTAVYPSGFLDSSFEYTAPYSPLVQLDLGPDTILCMMQNLMLQTGGGFEDCLWQDSSRLPYFLVTYDSINTIYCSVMVADSVGCIATDSIVITYDICNGIDQTNNSTFIISPNPASSQFNISMQNFIGTERLIEIFNVTGEIISSIRSDKNIERISLALHAGIYFVKVNDGEKKFIQKLVVTE